MQPGAAPQDGGVVGKEHPDRDDLHVVGDGRDDHSVEGGGRLVHAHHPRHGKAEDVGVHEPDFEAGGGHGGREIDRDGGFAHAALAGCDGEDPREAALLGEGDDAVGRAPAQLRLQLGALLGVHGAHLDEDALDAFELADDVLHVGGDGVAQGTARGSQEYRDHDRAVVFDLDVVDHVEVGDRSADLGVDDAFERAAHFVEANHGNHRTRLVNAPARPSGSGHGSSRFGLRLFPFRPTALRVRP